MNKSTAVGAEGAANAPRIHFISDSHEEFYYSKMQEVRWVDAYHKALIYCLGICEDTRRNIYRIYDFKSGSKTATDLAYAEVIDYNKKNLERELSNESRRQSIQHSKTKRRAEEI